MLAGRDENAEEGRWAMHCLILYANEFGQPKGQDLVDNEVQGTSGTAGISITTPSVTAVPTTTATSATTATLVVSATGGDSRKRKRDTSSDESLEDRVANLEKSARSPVQELKEKVRSLCMMAEPSTPLILITLEELAKVAKKEQHDESEVFEELARQALRHQTKLDIASLCLSVMGGKAADVITKAISKCMRVEKSVESKKEFSPPKSEDSPLYNLYPSQPPYAIPPQIPPYYGSYARGYNPGFRGRNRFRPRSACLFCDSTSHTIRDCDEMKDARKIKSKK